MLVVARTAHVRAHHFRKGQIFHGARRAACLLAGVFFLCINSFAAAVTQSTGGSNISADTTGGTYTTLTGPVYTEGSSGAVGTGTFVLNAPSGFVFDTGGTPPTVEVGQISAGLFGQQINDASDGDLLPVTVTATTLSITITSKSTSGARSSLTWQNVRVRPTAGTPLASGIITKSGTSAVSGVNTGTSFGTLTEVYGAAARLAISVQPSSPTEAGQRFADQPEVNIVDQFGNVVANSAVVVTAARSGGSGTLQGTINKTANNGLAKWTDLSHQWAGTITLSFSSPGLISATSNPIIITPSDPDALSIYSAPSSVATAGVAFPAQPVVAVVDQYGNVVTNDNARVITAARLAGAGTLQGTLTATTSGGLATYSGLNHRVATNITIRFTTGGLTAITSGTITVNPAAAATMVILTQPSTTATAGLAFAQQPYIELLDAFSNRCTTDFSTVVTATRLAGGGTLAGNVTPVSSAGLVSFSNLSHCLATNITIQFTAPGVTSATSGTVTISPGAKAMVGIVTQPSATATAGVNLAQQPVVEIQDACGNRIPGDTSVVTVMRGAGSGTLQGTLTAAASNGTATFSGLNHRVAGTIALVFSSPGLVSATSSSIVITPASPSALAIQSAPSSVATAGVAFAAQPIIAVVDQYGNVVTNDNSRVITASRLAGAGTLNGISTASTSGGLASYSGLNHRVATNITIQFTATGLTSVTSGTITINPAAASALFLLAQPSTNATAGVPFAQQPVVELRDLFGNRVTTDSSTVVTASRLAGSGVLQGTLNVSSSSGVVTFSGLNHRVAGVITILFSATGISGITSGTITINPAAADRLVFTTQPGAAVVGAPFGTQPRIRTEDQYGNVSMVGIGANLDVTMSLTAGTGTLIGTTSHNIGTGGTGGMINYTDLQINSAGAGKQLTASAAGLIPAVSSLFSVSKADQTITFPVIPDKQFGDVPFTISATASSGLPVTFTVDSGPATISGNTVTLAGTGTVTIRASQAGDADYNAAPDVTRVFIVGKPTLTITAENKSITYGQAVPGLTYTITGFVNGDGPADLDSLPNLSTTAVDGSPAGTYPIEVSGAASDNYTIVYVNGVLTINKSALTIKADDKSKAYGAPLPAFTATYTGFVNGDTAANLDSPVTYSTTATAASSVGTYPITPGGATDSNYTITFQNGTLTITPVNVTITANDTAKLYGAALPAFSASYSGLVNGDTGATFLPPPVFNTTATVSSPIGNYPITVSGASNANYIATYVSGTLTVDKAPLQIRADNKTAIIGDPLPNLTASYIGFVNGDTAAVLTAPVQLSTTATISSPIGKYPITASGATAANYVITHVNGTLSITGRRVDLIVLYTDAARAAAGGTTTIKSQVMDAVREVNQVFANSQIDVDLRLLYMGSATYTESGDAQLDLTRLKTVGDGYLEIAHTNRHEFGADIVVLIEENTGASESAGFTMDSPNVNFRDSAFVVVKRTAMRTSYTLAHEIGHIFGCQHDTAHATSSGSYSYSRGFSFVAGGNTYRTIMAEGTGTRIPYFSNPAVQYLSVATGQNGVANNAWTIRTNTSVVAAFNEELSIVGFSAESTTVRETNGTIYVDVERTGALEGTATVLYSTRGITAVEGNDYVAQYSVLTFNPGEDVKSIPLPILNDSLFETNEVVQVVLLSATNAVLGLESLHNITIEDDEVGFLLEQKSVTVSETTNTVTVNVLRTGDPAGPASIDYRTVDGTAQAGQDFTGALGTISFSAGVTNRSVQIPITNDSLVERNETFSLMLTNTGASQVVGANSVSITILEDDVGFGFNTNAVSTFENGSVTLSVYRTGNLTGVVSVLVATTNGTAASGSDYVALSTNLVFNPGITNRFVTVQMVNNNVGESDETFHIELRNPVGGLVTTYSNATVTIFDNDSSFTFLTNNISVSESKTSLIVPVRRTAGAATAGSVGFSTAPGTALATADYTTTRGTLSFKAGETNKNLTIAIKNDTLLESTEQFTLYLTNAVGDTTLGLFPTTTISIADNDSRLSWETNVYYVLENSGSAVLKVNRTGALTETNTVSYSVTASTARTTDYTATSGKLIFLPGATNAAITIPLINDDIVETNEIFRVRLSSPGGGALLLGTNTATVVIMEDQVGFTFESPTYAIAEDGGALNVSIYRRGKSDTSASVAFQTIAGTALSGADFTSTNGTLSFSAGEEVKTVGIAIIDDSLVEQNKTFSLALSNPSGAVIIGPASAAITILEDDSQISFFTNTVAAAESLSTLSINVMRTGGTNFPSTVEYFTTDGTASSSDYYSTNGTLTFGVGITKRTIFVPLRNDSLVEGDENFSIILTNFSGASPGAFTNASAVIRDNDSVISFATNSVLVSENVRSTALLVVRTGGVVGAASVRFTSSPGTATATSDYKNASGLLSFKAGETNKLLYPNIVNDALVESNETFTVSLSSPTGESSLTNASSTVTIIDDEASAAGDVMASPAEVSMRMALDSTRRLVNFYLDGPIGATVRVESSCDLFQWESHFEAVLSDQPLHVTLPADPVFEFYRLLPGLPQDQEDDIP